MIVKGRVHSFESFGTLDGPGIRFVVFMQGCPLRCLYCHNRDTWNVSGGHEYTTDEVMEEVEKYINYFRFSGGGVTVSGGEPLLQHAFVTELFKKCREKGIHTALDTSGYTDLINTTELVDTTNLDHLFSYTNLVLLDIKHINEEGHKLLTSKSREKTSSFARLLAARNIPVWIRYILVPGYTDSEDDLQQAAAFIKSMPNVEKAEVLPYHTLGSFKWDELGYEYPLTGVLEPTSQSLEKARQILEK